MADIFADFTPHPEVACTQAEFDPAIHKAVYKHNYPQIFEEIAAGRLDQREAFHTLIKTDLFFIAYFIAGWEDKSMSGNKPFIVKQCQLIEDGPQTGTVDVWAREHGKSACITIAGTVQRVVNDPECTTAIFSFKKPAAEKFLDSIRKIFELPIMIWCFPDVLYEKPESQAPSWSLQNGIRVKRKNTTRREHTVEAFGLVEGMPIGGHFDHRIYDDIETDDIAKNPEQMQLCFDKLMISRAIGREGGTERVIGTYYSHCGVLVKLENLKDIYGNKMYQLRVYPASYDGTENGKPVFFSQQYWDSKKIDRRTLNTQFLCNPTPVADVKLHFNRFKPIERRKLPKDRLKFMIVDPAGDKDVQAGIGNDKWAMGVLSVDLIHDELGLCNVYVEDLICRELSTSGAQDAACSMYMRNGRIVMLGVERVATDSAWKHIQNALEARGRYLELHKKGKFGGNLTLLSPAGRSKNLKIENNLAWPLNNAKLHLVDDLPDEYVEELQNECDKFPFFHVDILDMMSYLYDILADPALPLYFATEEEDEEDEGGEEERTGRSAVGGY